MLTSIEKEAPQNNVTVTLSKDYALNHHKETPNTITLQEVGKLTGGKSAGKKKGDDSEDSRVHGFYKYVCTPEQLLNNKSLLQVLGRERSAHTKNNSSLDIQSKLKKSRLAQKSKPDKVCFFERDDYLSEKSMELLKSGTIVYKVEYHHYKKEEQYTLMRYEYDSTTESIYEDIVSNDKPTDAQRAVLKKLDDIRNLEQTQKTGCKQLIANERKQLDNLLGCFHSSPYLCEYNVVIKTPKKPEGFEFLTEIIAGYVFRWLNDNNNVPEEYRHICNTVGYPIGTEVDDYKDAMIQKRVPGCTLSKVLSLDRSGDRSAFLESGRAVVQKWATYKDMDTLLKNSESKQQLAYLILLNILIGNQSCHPANIIVTNNLHNQSIYNICGIDFGGAFRKFCLPLDNQLRSPENTGLNRGAFTKNFLKKYRKSLPYLFPMMVSLAKNLLKTINLGFLKEMYTAAIASIPDELFEEHFVEFCKKGRFFTKKQLASYAEMDDTQKLVVTQKC